jgi:hypothetical protein
MFDHDHDHAYMVPDMVADVVELSVEDLAIFLRDAVSHLSAHWGSAIMRVETPTRRRDDLPGRQCLEICCACDRLNGNRCAARGCFIQVKSPRPRVSLPDRLMAAGQSNAGPNTI